MSEALPPPVRARLQRQRQAARAVLAFERAWPALWPALGVAGGFVCAALLGLPQRLPPAWHATLLAGVLAAIGVLGWTRLRRLRLPDGAAADRRLERDGGLAHRPLAALADRAAAGSGDAALWAAHLARLRADLGRLRLRLPRPGLAARDPRAWRALLGLGLVASLAIAGADAPARLLAAVHPVFPPPVPPPAARLQAWLTPPGYTGMAPILLSPAQPDVSAPAGSRLSASLSGGGGGAPALTLAGHPVAFQPIEAGSWQAETDLSTGGTLLVSRDGAEIGRWQLTAVADVAPSVQWPSAPGAGRGRMPALRLPWQVAHPYGVAALQAEIRLRDRPDAPALLVPIPLPGAPRGAKGVRVADLLAHPWAGLPVTATLLAHDTAGLAGRSAERAFVLPERAFANPAARLLVAVRRMLALRPAERGPPLAALHGLAGNVALWRADSGAFLNLQAIMDLLAGSPTAGPAAERAVASAQDRLWELALHLEEGAVARSERALAEARRALHEAMQAMRHPGDAKLEPGAKADAARRELARREQALQQALQQYMQALREQALADPRHPAAPENEARQAQEALRRLQDATKAGPSDQAQQERAQERMAELDQALDALEQAGREAMATPAERQRAAQRQRGRDQMGVLSDLIRREAGVLDHAQSRASPPDQPPATLDFPPGDSLGGVTPSAPPDNGPPRQADAAVQQALRRALGDLMQDFGDLTGQVPKNLGDADQGMHDATAALRAGHDQSAADAAQRAIAALQQGGQDMRQQLTRQFGQGQGQDGQGSDGGIDQPGQGQDGQGDSARGDGRPRTDPFGRALQEGAGGVLDGGDTAVPDTMEQARTRAVQDELRRRGADRSRPPRELDYIGRLLDTP